VGADWQIECRLVAVAHQHDPVSRLPLNRQMVVI